MCTVRVEDGLVVSSYTFPVGDGTITANTRMTPDEAEGYRFTLAALILQARGGVAPRKELVDRLSGRVRLIAAARLPAEPPSEDDAMRSEPMPMHEARALLDYIGTLELLVRRIETCVTQHFHLVQDLAEVVAVGLAARELLGLHTERSHGTPPVSDPRH